MANQYLVPGGGIDVVPAGWTPVGSGSLSTALDETPTADGDTTHVLVETDDVYTTQLKPPTYDPGVHTGHAIVINFAGGSGARGSFAWALRQGGSTLVNDVTTVGVADEYSEEVFTLAAGVVANITNYSNLYLDVTSVLDGDPSLKLTMVHLRIPGPVTEYSAGIWPLVLRV